MHTLANSEYPDELLHYIMLHLLHFIRVYTICLDKNNLQRKIYNSHLEIIARVPMIYTIDYPKFIVSNQKEESNSAYRIKKSHEVDKSIS